jgi:hypothetical protein
MGRNLRAVFPGQRHLDCRLNSHPPLWSSGDTRSPPERALKVQGAREGDSSYGLVVSSKLGQSCPIEPASGDSEGGFGEADIM